jgi:hypothetical protein
MYGYSSPQIRQAEPKIRAHRIAIERASLGIVGPLKRTASPADGPLSTREQFPQSVVHEFDIGTGAAGIASKVTPLADRNA